MSTMTLMCLHSPPGIDAQYRQTFVMVDMVCVLMTEPTFLPSHILFVFHTLCYYRRLRCPAFLYVHIGISAVLNSICPFCKGEPSVS